MHGTSLSLTVPFEVLGILILAPPGTKFRYIHIYIIYTYMKIRCWKKRTHPPCFFRSLYVFFHEKQYHAGNISQIKNSGGRVFNDSGSSHSRNSQRKFSGKLPIYELLGSLTGIVVLAMVVLVVVARSSSSPSSSSPSSSSPSSS